jgi:CRISPR system Cascade subunit CasD
MNAVHFSIRAPLASWSESGAAYRPTDTVPSWSALVGLCGAALGWERGDPRLAEFAQDYAPAIRSDTGERLVDYHTVQTPHRPTLQRPPRSRAEELAAETVNTTVTRREYVQDVRYEILMVPVAEAPVVAAEALARALRHPRFTLYAGRRSCPLGRVPATVVESSLDGMTHVDTRLADLPWVVPSLIRERRDMPVGWRKFAVRREAVA